MFFRRMHFSYLAGAGILFTSLSCGTGYTGTYVLTFTDFAVEGACVAEDQSFAFDFTGGVLVDFYDGPNGTLTVVLDEYLVGTLEKKEFEVGWSYESVETDGDYSDAAQDEIVMEGTFDGEYVSGTLTATQTDTWGTSGSMQIETCEVSYSYTGWRMQGSEDDYIR